MRRTEISDVPAALKIADSIASRFSARFPGLPLSDRDDVQQMAWISAWRALEDRDGKIKESHLKTIIERDVHDYMEKELRRGKIAKTISLTGIEESADGFKSVNDPFFTASLEELEVRHAGREDGRANKPSEPEVLEVAA